MIQSFRDKQTEDLYITRKSRLWSNIQEIALRKLGQINAADELLSLANPPGNKLEALKKDRAGQHSIRINDQYRICFEWREDGAHEVQVIDYH